MYTSIPTICQILTETLVPSVLTCTHKSPSKPVTFQELIIKNIIKYLIIRVIVYLGSLQTCMTPLYTFLIHKISHQIEKMSQ